MNATPVRPIVFEFCTVSVSDVVPFSGMLAAPNALLMAGGDATATVTLALAVFPVPPSVDVTLPVVLFLTPAEVPVTLTDTVQLPLAATVPADRLTAEEPATAIRSAHQILRPGGQIMILDLLTHHFEKAGELYGDRWPGFAESDLQKWLEDAGFKKIEISIVAAEEQPPHFQTLLASGEKTL